MDPYHSADEPSRQAVDYPDDPNHPFPSSSGNQPTFTIPSTVQDWVVNNGATGRFAEQPRIDPFSLQGGVIPHPQAYHGVSDSHHTSSSFEYQEPVHRAPPTEQNHRYSESLLNNSFMGEVGGMHPTAASSLSFSSELRTLIPVPSQPPTAILWPFASASQLTNEIFQHSAPTQCPSDAQQTSSRLMALGYNDPGPSEPEPIKLSAGRTENIKALLLQCSWYTEPKEEPDVKPDDPFVTEGHILSMDKSRFSAFVSSNLHGRKWYCRIKHDVRQKKEVVECTFSAKHPKDTIAHVCEYLNYKPYKCKGTKWHLECDSTYPTNERRNDHYAKKKKGTDALEACRECGASITARNLPRHIETLHNTNQPEYS